MSRRETVVFTDAASGPGFLALHGQESGHRVEVPADQPDQIMEALENWDTITEQ